MTKLKSRLGAFLAVTALSGAILAGFTACPLDSASEAAGAVGYGQVTIDCGDAAESVDRSVFPGKTGLTYEYAFTKSGGSPQTITPENGAFTLEYGEWTVEVKAYAGSDQSVSNLAATGTKSFTVNAASLTVAVELTGVSDTGNGTFKYKI
ncbi:MAG: hypothetical protein LBG73_11120, partial [Spirochaetaceae bacterium]|nr:hypothetical protein [Spirochaetaceae bacterium]